ncbi:MAG TPA: 2-amino-4-hydroxy-6-hydroxymethyldihydropteridine diphosphokinase [Bryobacteraceae bacterium]|nr:2-amino-4-hydroxy-6-hydroxymethyldihydropteridine diphosphokinase [Bryobacteraceae bacterium]
MRRALRHVYLSLGSNLGDRKANLERALAALEAESIRVTARSSFYETQPQEVWEQPWFLNLAVACETEYLPLQFLVISQRIERELGRVRGPGLKPKGPRLIDIDILLYGNVVMQNLRLTIPHPRLPVRRFVLEPLVEIAPDLRHPGTGRYLRDYLRKVRGQQLRKL